MCRRLGGINGAQKELGVINFSAEKETKNYQWGTGFFVHYRIVSAVTSVQFISVRVSYIVLRGRLCHIMVQNMYTGSE